MKYAHLIKLTVFSYENENNKHILDSFLRFFPFNFNIDDNKVILKKTDAMGFNDKKIEILEITLAKTNLINQFLKNLLSHLNENQKNQIMQQIESRLDKNLDLFLRFEKDTWVNERKLVLTDSGKCFHIKMSIAAFPKKREVALNAVKDLFSEK